MNPMMKFAAHERGSARTLIMVPGSRRSAAVGGVAVPPGVVRVPANGVVPSGFGREASLPLVDPPHSGGGDAGMREVPGMRTVTCRAGQKIFGPGGGGGAVYLLRSGCVALFKALPGRRSICVGLLGPDDIFMQENGRDGVAVSGVSAEVLADATAAVFEIEALPRLMAAAPDLAATVVAGFAQRLTGVQGLVEQLLSRDITLRLASILAVLSDRFGEPGEDGYAAIAIPMPHKLLARLIGANRVTVTRVITEFRLAGLAESRGRNQLGVDPVKVRAYIQRIGRAVPVGR
jgi:CRP-like cAMP-binding protein